MIHLTKKCPVRRGSRVLVLEDSKDRIFHFKKSLIGCFVDCQTSVEGTLKLLQEEDWDYLFLDHDLDGQIYVPSGPGTGWAVAEWLSQNPDRTPENVIIHTLNDIAQYKMQKLVRAAAVIPGAWFLIELT